MSNIKERILQLAKSKGVSNEKFCKKIEMSYSSFKSSAKNTPLNSDAIGKILSLYPDVSADWLIIGEGKMLKNYSIPQPNIQINGNDNIGISNRLREVRQILCNSSNTLFAKKLGCEPSITSNWMKDASSIDLYVIKSIAYIFPEVNLEWLIIGGGEMLKSNQYATKNIDLASRENKIEWWEKQMQDLIAENKTLAETNKILVEEGKRGRRME